MGRLAAEGTAGETEIVNRTMSQAELDATRDTGLVRGGRAGTHFVSNDLYATAGEAKAQLSLPQLPDLVAELEVPRGAFSESEPVPPDFGEPGGGTQRLGEGPIPARVGRVQYYGGP